MIKNIKYVFLCILFYISCTEEFIADKSQFKASIIIEGWVYNDTTPINVNSFVKVYVSKSSNEFITDTLGILSNLLRTATITIKSTNQPIDTLVLQFSETSNFAEDGWTGAYISNNIKGIVDETYELKVEVEGEIYEAEATMFPIQKMDSISFSRKQVEKENQNLYVPLANFTDPLEEDNYYLFRPLSVGVNMETQDTGMWLNKGVDPWLISVFSDEYINGKHASLNITEGIKTDRYWMDGNFDVYPGKLVGIQMQSISKEAFEYYKSLISQLNFTAGVFHPAPANAPTNISNGGFGFFGASAISYGIASVPEN